MNALILSLIAVWGALCGAGVAWLWHARTRPLTPEERLAMHRRIRRARLARIAPNGDEITPLSMAQEWSIGYQITIPETDREPRPIVTFICTQ